VLGTMSKLVCPDPAVSSQSRSAQASVESHEAGKRTSARRFFAYHSRAVRPGERVRYSVRAAIASGCWQTDHLVEGGGIHRCCFSGFPQARLLNELTHASAARSFLLCELVHALMRQAEYACGVPGAHLQVSSSQNSYRSPSGHCGASIFLFRFPAQRCVGANRLLRDCRQPHIIDNLGRTRVDDEQLHRLDDAAAGLVDGAPLRVAATQSPHGSNPPAGLVSLVRDVIGLHDFFNHPFPRHRSRSRSMRRSKPGPMSSPAWTGTVVTHFPHSIRTCDPR
jgi:hypothetical protein